MTTFDDKRIAELRDLIGRLPPAPWLAEQPGGCVEIKTIGYRESYLVADARSLPIASSTTAAGDPPAVAAFIAVARTALPEALDEIERLRKAIRNKHEQVCLRTQSGGLTGCDTACLLYEIEL